MDTSLHIHRIVLPKDTTFENGYADAQVEQNHQPEDDAETALDRLVAEEPLRRQCTRPAAAELKHVKRPLWSPPHSALRLELVNAVRAERRHAHDRIDAENWLPNRHRRVVFRSLFCWVRVLGENAPSLEQIQDGFLGTLVFALVAQFCFFGSHRFRLAMQRPFGFLKQTG